MRRELTFDGAVALITGAGRGLGRGYARALADRGCHVVVNDAGVSPSGDPSDEHPAELVVAEIAAAGGTAVAAPGDVVTSAAAIVAHAVDTFGRLDIVINNAGIITFGMFDQLTPDQFDKVVSVNLQGSIAVTRAAWPHLKRAPSGRIVNVSSSTVFGVAGESHYVAAKAGVLGFTRALASEGRQHRIGANAIMPVGNTRLMGGDATTDLAFQAFISNFDPHSVAPLVVWLAHPETEATGQTFSVGAGRAARVVLGVAEGVVPEHNTPEGWQDCAGELMSNTNYVTPDSIMEEMLLYAKDLGVSNQPVLPT